MEKPSHILCDRQDIPAMEITRGFDHLMKYRLYNCIMYQIYFIMDMLIYIYTYLMIDTAKYWPFLVH